MLRLKRPLTARVPHSLALVGALLLITSILAGAGLPAASGRPGDAQIAQNDTAASGTPSQVSAQRQPNERSRFRMSLFLFRR